MHRNVMLAKDIATSYTNQLNPTPNHFSMAIHEMGNGHCRKTSHSSGRKNVHASYDGLLLKMDRSAQVKDKEVVSFIKRNILTRFGIPSEIICDNGSQFISKRTSTSAAPGELK